MSKSRLPTVVCCAVLLAACGSMRETPVASSATAVVEKPNLFAVPGTQLTVTGTGVRRLWPGLHVLPARVDEDDSAAILVSGAKDLVLDLTGAVLRGQVEGRPLDECHGCAIFVVNSERVTIRGGSIGGYKTCIAAFDSKDVVVEDVAFDSWYGMRLLSTPQAEDPADWLWPHENDAEEWMKRYGAAIALYRCPGATVTRCRGRHGQNGILLARSNDCLAVDNDFSFLSGWGLALYRSSRNRVAHCVFDYCVRGYSHDVYWRGQDSAGILLFERSSDNVFVENSATHCGDGVFLFGGKDVVEGRAEARGEKPPGGSDRNVFYRNDFSYAVANAIEATFSSDNWAIENRLDGSRQHGVWGGYSTRLVLLWNEIQGTHGGAVSIEHGVDCAIVGNRIEDADVGLELWWDEDPEFVDGAYGKRFDTRSRGHYVAENRFGGNAKDVEIRQTDDLAFALNVFAAGQPPPSLTGVVVAGENRERLEPKALIEGRDGTLPSGRMRDVGIAVAPAAEPGWLARAKSWRPPSLLGSLWSYAAPRPANSGLETIVMGEFGPWDFRSGEPRPEPRAFGGALADATWNATWFAWTPDGGEGADTDPRRDAAAWRALAGHPLTTGLVRAWTDPFGGSKSVRAATGTTHIGLVANSAIQIPVPGTYTLRVTSDDGVRILVDGKVVLENWTWHGPTRDESAIALEAGRHEFVLEYFQIDGACALAVDLAVPPSR